MKFKLSQICSYLDIKGNRCQFILFWHKFGNPSYSGGTGLVFNTSLTMEKSSSCLVQDDIHVFNYCILYTISFDKQGVFQDTN